MALSLVLVSSAGTGCQSASGATRAVYPNAEAFAQAPEFEGTWRGKIDRYQGELRIGELSPHRFFGNFSSDHGGIDLALLMDQSSVQTLGGTSMDSNRLLFTWQDGEGARGHGWMKINERGELLLGESGPLEQIEGSEWKFERTEGQGPSAN